MKCTSVHICPTCNRRWTHDNTSDQCYMAGLTIFDCAACCGIAALNERFTDDFKDWALEVRRKARVAK